MRAAEVADVLEEIGRLLELKGENPFKVRAYANAARALGDLTEPLDAVLAEGRLREIPGIGAAIADKIVAFVETGSIPLLERLRGEIPAGVLDLVAEPLELLPSLRCDRVLDAHQRAHRGGEVLAGPADVVDAVLIRPGGD